MSAALLAPLDDGAENTRTVSVSRPCLNTQPRPGELVGSGIDSLDISVYANWGTTWQDTYSFFDDLKARAQQPEAAKRPVFFSAAKTDFHVHPTGKAPQYRFHLECGDGHLYIGKSQRAVDQTPNVYMSFKSESLWRQPLLTHCETLLALLSVLGADVTAIKPSRCDVAADVYLPEGITFSQFQEQAVCRSGKTSNFQDGNELEGCYYGGRTSPVKLRAYNKTKEINEHSHKFWFYELWNVAQGDTVWRFEFQLRREFLKSFGVDTMDDLIEKLPGIWDYLTGDWFSLREGSDSNRSRRPFSQLWQNVRNASQRFGNVTRITRTLPRRDAMSEEWYVTRLRNYLVTFGALCNIDSLHKAVICLENTLNQRNDVNGFAEAVRARQIEKGWLNKVNKTEGN